MQKYGYTQKATRVSRANRVSWKVIIIFLLAFFLIPPLAGSSGSTAPGVSGLSDRWNVYGGAVDPWHSHTMKDGETYNISKLKWTDANTTVYIDKGGTYYLKGSSKYVRIVIRNKNAGDVKVYLADGLKIKTGALSYVGSRTAAITVYDSGGTVTLISEKNANINLSGYMAPAIRKDGTKTKLVFETKDPKNPGHITANAGHAAAAIGSVSHITGGKVTTGNMVFNGGHITATGGGGDGAAIGGGQGDNCKGITINGGVINATAKGHGAGIGGGLGGYGKDITINGGTVTAKGGSGAAGIGGGGDSSEAIDEQRDGVNITINGGTVTAIGASRGAGIGGGIKGDGKNIVINGGTVTATGGQFGIGIGGGGGDLDPGYGEVTINGGNVTATGGDGLPGIGGEVMNTSTGGQEKSTIKINGGNVTARGGSNASHDVGGDKGTTITFTGGNIDVRTTNIDIKNQEGKILHRTQATFIEEPAGSGIASFDISGITNPYKTTGMTTFPSTDTEASDVYLWLPDTAAVNGATDANGISFSAAGTPIKGGGSGLLYQPTKLILDKNGGTEDGAAIGVYGMKTLQSYTKPAGPTGYHASEYRLIDGGPALADGDGNLKPNVMQWTDADGAWKEVRGELTVYTQWEANTYYAAFDANKPDAASNDVEGTMEKQTFKYDEAAALTANGYSLTGWRFTGWNTRSDGTGTSYGDGSEVTNLTAENEATVTLYAQWQPMEYTVTFYPGDAGTPEEAADAPGADAAPEDPSAKTTTQTLAYDTPVQLKPLEFDTPAKSAFLGWDALALGSHLYGNEEIVVNLCTINDNGEPVGSSLTAQWISAGNVAVQVNRDGAACNVGDLGLDDTWDTVALQSGSTFFALEASGNAGRYVAEGNKIPTGSYDICLYNSGSEESLSTGKSLKVNNDETGAAVLDYYTVSMAMEPGYEDYGTVAITADDSTGAAGAETSAVALDGAEVTITTEITKTGYQFSKYTASLHEPIWQGGDRTLAEQTITITGQAQIIAHPAPIHYHLVFDKNAENAEGEMNTQNFTYDEPQNLYRNAFTRECYTFEGWTPTAEWKSRTEREFYKDEAEVVNLSSVNDETLTFYAQWTPYEYFIQYDANAQAAGEMEKQKTFHDNVTKLRECEYEVENYHFTGWNTEPSGKGEAYEEGQEVKNLTGEKGATFYLYAQWEHDYYEIAYNANGGEGAMETERILTHESVPLAAASFTREGYTFTGWNTMEDGSGESYDDKAKVSDLGGSFDTITLYAQWQEAPEEAAEGDSADDVGENIDVGDGPDAGIEYDEYIARQNAEEQGLKGDHTLWIGIAAGSVAVIAAAAGGTLWFRRRRK